MNLLLAEDDAILADALTAQLRHSGFEIEWAENGAVAEYLLLKQAWDLCILDLGLPMVDGLTVLQRVRQRKPELPVLVLTALDDLQSRVAGLNAGADDYLTKPFDFPELEARLRALLRRAQAPANAGASGTSAGGARGATDSAVSMGALVFEREARRATIGGTPLELSPREWALLDLLLTRRDKVVTKEDVAQAWSSERAEPGGNNAIEVYIHRLRRKLEGSGTSIRTVRGLGYLLEDARS